jgi:NAD(P)-dependent dehydrogenase (short-subunit alcohol dehydrogenase family)
MRQKQKNLPNIFLYLGDYDMTATIHSDTYPAIDPTKADLTGKAVFVTGGSRGLGRAMVLSFAQAGASYIAVGARSDLSQVAKDAEAAALSANRAAPKFLPINLDIADPKSVEDAAAAVEKAFGRCDIVVNNAGVIGDMVLIGDSNPDAWWRVLEVNLRGPYLISRAFLPLLLKTGDAYVVNISSVGAHLVGPTLSAYQISKLSVLRFSQFLNAEYAGKGVVSFAIHPGNIPTDMVGGHEGVPDHLKQGPYHPRRVPHLVMLILS